MAHFARLAGCLTLIATATAVSWGEPVAKSAVLYNPILDGAAAYECTLEVDVGLSPVDSTWIDLPLPEAGVVEACGFQWRASSPVLLVKDRAGLVVLSKRTTSRDRLIHGVRHRLHFGPATSADATVRVEVTFSETLSVKVEAAAPPVIEKFGEGPTILAPDDGVSVRLRELTLTLQPPQTLYDSTASDHPDSVLKNQRGSCDGFSNVIQRWLKSEGVRSRTALTLLAPFTGHGRTDPGRGSRPHSIVEYRAECGWVPFEPSYSHNFLVPQVRLATAESIEALKISRSESVRDFRMSYVVSRRDDIRVLGRRRFNPRNQHVRPLAGQLDYYALKQLDHPCSEICWSAAGR